MINKRLIQTVGESKKYIAANVLCQWISLLANITLMAAVARVLAAVIEEPEAMDVWPVVGVTAFTLVLRFLCTWGSARMGYCSSRTVKKRLREKIYQKLLRLGSTYREQARTSEVVQVAVEGVDQLETYFGAYLPQFFYAMLAPITLFVVLCFVSWPVALVLFCCVPLIPVAIAAVQTWAKKLLSKYWGKYTELGDTFLENLQGLTTLKIYQADHFKQQEMNEQAEKFRKITMKVLTMQLNSITIMDLIAYGGAALGIILAITQYQAGAVSLMGSVLILLLAADFFLPMRQLGSFFHIAMNGMAASEKIFRLLDLKEETPTVTESFPAQHTLHCEQVDFAYEPDRPVLQGVTLTCRQGQFTALVGESGCGKSTLASLLIGRRQATGGSVTVGNVPLSSIREENRHRNITYVGHQSYLFQGTVRDNLLMGKPTATDEEMWQVLKKVNLDGFLRAEQGLLTPLQEKAANLSGGQRQRLALARALLHDSPIYIFDEATTNIDVESETILMEQIQKLAQTKTVLLVSHRLMNVVDADTIYVMEKGRVVESGRHPELLARHGVYFTLWDTQQELEQYSPKGETA